MLIVSTDGILAAALEAMLAGAGVTDIRIRTSVPASSHEPAVIDIDTVSGRCAGAVITVSADRTRGADLLRPFSERQFIALITPLLKKETDITLPKAGEKEDTTPLLKLSEGGVIYRSTFIPLTPAEGRIISLLIENAGQPVGSDRLTAAIGEGGSDNSLRVYICYLREKLDFAFSERLIYTVRGKGYMISPSREDKNS